MAHEEHSDHVNYFYVFLLLCVFTAASVVADVVHIDSKLVVIVIVLAIATAKAMCVMMFFMHLKFEGNWKYVLLAPTVILAIGLPLALLPDVGVHYYPADPQYPANVMVVEPHESGGDSAEEAHNGH